MGSIHELVQLSKIPYFRTVKALAVLGVVLFFGGTLGGRLGAEETPPAPSDPKAVALWLSDLGFRREGSPAEAHVFLALKLWFSGRADLQETDFSDMDDEYSFSKRLWFRVPGPLHGELVVVAPTDGANDRGLAWAAAWAEDALTRGTKVSVTFLFTGAERGSGASAGLGSRAFLHNFYPIDPAAVLYLDTREKTDDVMLITESGSFPTPLWLLQGVSNFLQREGLVPKITGSSPSLFRLDLPERRNALSPWFERSIPAIGVGDGPSGPMVPVAFENFAASLPGGLPAQGDQHYLAFHFGSWRMFLDQETYVNLFLGLAAVVFFGYALLGRSRRGSLRTVGVGFWQLPLLFSLVYLALMASSQAADFLQQVRGDPEFWKATPWAVMAFKSVVATGLTLLVLLPFRRSPFSSDPDFYAQSALVLLGLMAVGAAAIELSFSFYFLWALVWAAVLVVVPWKTVKLLCLFGGPLWLIWGAYGVFGPNADLELSRWVLTSSVAGNFILTALIFPFLLQITAWHLSGRRHQERNEGFRALVQLTFWGLGSLALAVVVLRLEPGIKPFQEPSARRLETSKASSMPRGLWETKVERSAFLSRSVWTLTFTGSLDPEVIDLDLVSSEPLTIFHCSFPVVLNADGTTARIVLGRDPPLPLVIKLTLPAKTQASLEVRASNRSNRQIDLLDSVELKP